MPKDIAVGIEKWRQQLLDTTKRNRLIHFRTGRGGGIALAHPTPAALWERLLVRGGSLTFTFKGHLLDDSTAPECPDCGVPMPSGAKSCPVCSWAPGRIRPGSEIAVSGKLPPGVALRALSSPNEPPPLEEESTDLNELQRCLRSPRLRADHLLTDLTDDYLARRLTRLAQSARESQSERGITVLFAVFGFLRWFESEDSEEEIRSPLLVVPVRLQRDNALTPWRLELEEEEVFPNFTLDQRLRQSLSLSLPDELDVTLEAEVESRTAFLDAVRQRIGKFQRWAVLDEVALGVFNFQKLAMWEDLGRNQHRIAEHRLCRAIAGDPESRPMPPESLPEPRELDDKTDPLSTYHILDADSSQHAAIAAASKGASLVLDGPPGTGKSQTIANIIADALATGKSILFVSEKAAALEVVKRRLDEHGVGDFCFELHSHKANKKEVLKELERCLALPPEPRRNIERDLKQLQEHRRELNTYVRALHAPRDPLGLTVFEVHGILASAPQIASTTRCPIPRIAERDMDFLQNALAVLGRVPEFAAVLSQTEHPWRGCRARPTPTLRDDATHHLRHLARALPAVSTAAAELSRAGFIAEPGVGAWRSALARARQTLQCPTIPADWFQGDAWAIASAIVRLDDLSKRYRELRTTMPELASEGPARVERLAQLSGELPPTPANRSLRTALAASEQTHGRWQRVRDLVDILVAQVRRVGELTGAKKADHTNDIARLETHLATLEGLVRPDEVCRGWWNAGHRRELVTVCKRAAEEDGRLRTLREELLARLLPEAFEESNSAIVREAAGYRSFLRFLSPRWWSLKSQLAGWYTQGSPSLPDIAKLADYHQRSRFIQQASTKYVDDLLPGPDWEKTLAALDDFEKRLGTLRLSQTVQKALAKEGDALHTAVSAAQSALGELSGLFAELSVSWPSGGLTGLPEWVVQHWLAAERDRDLWRDCVALLLDGKDLPQARAAELVQLAIELLRIQREATRLGGVVSRNAPLERDWSADRPRAESLTRLFQGGSATSGMIAALTGDRSELTRLVERAGSVDQTLAGPWQFLTEQLFDPDATVSTGIVLNNLPLADLQTWANARAEDVDRLREWQRFAEVEQLAKTCEVEYVLDEIRRDEVLPEEAAEAFRLRFLRLWLDEVYSRAQSLRDFSSENREQLIERFADLDRRSIEATTCRVRETLLNQPDRPGRSAHSPPEASELGLLMREINKKRRHLSLRKLFASIPNVLARVKPCLMMSPLSVSTYLESESYAFDVVIFDEASQVRPHDAISAIFRGKQLIVAGDQKQLPPTSFFERSDEGSEEDDDGTSDFESILDVCATLGLPRRRLRWHYRSRREPLIAFANHHIYDGELVTFPSVYDTEDGRAVEFDFVADGRWLAGAGGGHNVVEARRTAVRILDHALKHPDISLGVISFSQRQQERILDELENLRKTAPEAEPFFAPDNDEPFFVKNLENVQGDERDVIFLSVGYGPDAHGKVAMRFGPLNRQGGERRLNVAVTRARQQMVVLSSMRSHDIDLSRTAAEGARLLREYLAYAEEGPAVLRRTITEVGEREWESPFEKEVFDELKRRGLSVHPQVGCGGFRIDLGIVDAAQPGRYLLGVECDGATYHAAATARDRDRLRQEVLERLGWRFCRVWSTDWVRDRERQVTRVLEALTRAKREPTGPRAPKPKPVLPPVVTPAPKTEGPPEASPESIHSVPEPDLQEKVLSALRSCGAMAHEDLVSHVARLLGYKRTGPRIRERVEHSIAELLSAKRITQVGETLVTPR